MAEAPQLISTTVWFLKSANTFSVFDQNHSLFFSNVHQVLMALWYISHCHSIFTIVKTVFPELSKQFHHKLHLMAVLKFLILSLYLQWMEQLRCHGIIDFSKHLKATPEKNVCIWMIHQNLRLFCFLTFVMSLLGFCNSICGITWG